MTDRPGATYATPYAVEAMDTALARVRAFSTAVDFRPPIRSIGEALEAHYKQLAVFDVREQLFRNLAPALHHHWAATLQPVVPVSPVLLTTSLLDFVDQLRTRLIDLFRPVAETADEVARRAHAALEAAAERAHAVLCADPDVRRRKAAVEAFAVRWIGLGKQVPARREAILEGVEDVLLSACWRQAPDEISTDLPLGVRLRLQVHTAARWHRPMWENQVRGYPIDQLERPAGRSAGGGLVTLGQHVLDPQDPYAVLEGGLDAQRRLRALMPLLKSDHRLVLLQYAHGDGITWREAALRAGLPAEAGESARRRTKRLGRELRARQLG
ncbi:hypothetical protein [Amycolatopsis sp. NPDC004625]|uniref:hypothetical protein n=1 Tax=Amycolatopsis sp. NPDC004625 TaxID=3154670 RepID=UPI0033A497B8